MAAAFNLCVWQSQAQVKVQLLSGVITLLPYGSLFSALFGGALHGFGLSVFVVVAGALVAYVIDQRTRVSFLESQGPKKAG